MRAISAAILLLVALSAPAIAEHCTGPTAQEDAISTCVGVEPCFYYDNDSCEPECVFDLWIYQETNGIAGLQREDVYRDDTCHGMVAGDTVIF